VPTSLSIPPGVVSAVYAIMSVFWTIFVGNETVVSVQSQCSIVWVWKAKIEKNSKKKP
jgi:hypothetical protein